MCKCKKCSTQVHVLILGDTKGEQPSAYIYPFYVPLQEDTNDLMDLIKEKVTAAAEQHDLRSINIIFPPKKKSCVDIIKTLPPLSLGLAVANQMLSQHKRSSTEEN